MAGQQYCDICTENEMHVIIYQSAARRKISHLPNGLQYRGKLTMASRAHK